MPPPARILLGSSSMSGGGSERQLLNLLLGLDRNRFSPTLYLLYRDGPLLNEVPADIPCHAFWDSHRPPSLNWPGRIHRWQYLDMRRRIVEGDIDLIYDRLFHMAMISGRSAQGTKAARVTTIVSPPSRDLPHSDRRLMWIKRRLLAKSYRAAEKILTVSESTAEDASRFYGIDPSRFEVIPSPIDIDKIDRLVDREWETQDFSADFNHVISLGRLSDEKGHRYLIDAFHLVHQRLVNHPSIAPLRLHLVGDGPERRSLEEQARRLGLESSVVFHGHQSNPYRFLVRSQLLCLPSLYEGFPNVLMEAMACRVPFVSTDASGSIGQLMDKTYRLPLARTQDSLSLAELMIDRFVQPARWLAKIDDARSYVEEHHGLPAWIERMQQIFEEAIQCRRSKGRMHGNR